MSIERSTVAEDEALHALTARFFKGLGDPIRLRILKLLEEGEKSVGDIVEYLDMPRTRSPCTWAAYGGVGT